jgi:cellulose synthase/poly-beta-1,6-N-acetylglucosamine synthase-like glycosyltransferase
LLHEDSLLKCAGALLDFEVETVAIGGNIFPVNGCVVRQGTLESIGTPRSALANFQFIEYIRAFMAGRIGWARINSLLIISGAFGLFKRRRIVDCGGYLTSSGKFGLDTVGEDMELVVRLARFMRERKHRFRIGYSYNANCWTEVPERLRILLRQRDRWHRGLIEIFSFHRDMIGRPRFGRIGTVAMPYFLLFEILGPWIEAQGYAMVVLGAIFGLLNPQIAAWLFVATVMLGVFISIASIIIAEQDVNYLSMRDVFKLIGFAVVENFGFRQLMSMWRIAGYISLLRGRSGWGAMARRGFDGKGKK